MRKRKIWASVLPAALAMLLMFSLFSGMMPITAGAWVTQEEVDKAKENMNKLKDENKELAEEKAALRKDINANLSEIQRMVAEKDIIDQEINLLNRQMANITQQISAYGLLIADKQDELEEAQDRLEELNRQNKARIRAMEEQGNLSYWSVLFRANSFSDLLDRLNMIREIAAADKRRLQKLADAADAVEEARLALETEKESLEDAKLELEEAQTEMALKRVDADTILAQLNARGEEYEALMREAEEAEQEILLQIAAAEKEYNKKKEELAEQNKPVVNVGNGQKPPASVTNGITWLIPCNYWVVSSPYGYRTDPVYGGTRFHHGIDLAGPQGTPIYASRAGTVTTATYGPETGYYVAVNHGDGFSTSYLHMTHFVVAAGQQVSAGQLLGYMGSTGKSTGPHLHFSIYYNGASQNPADYIKFY